MLGGVVVNAVPASYPKIIGPFEACRKNNVDGGTRRSYNGSTDQYVDTPTSGLTTWAAGGPLPSLITAGYTLQFQTEATNLEAGGPPTTPHICRLRIAGAAQGSQAANPLTSALAQPGSQSGNDVMGSYVAPSGGQTVAGAITWGDYETANTGNTMHTGNFVTRYQYARS